MARIRRTAQATKLEENPDQAIVAQLDSLQDAADQERDRRPRLGMVRGSPQLFQHRPGYLQRPDV